MRNYPMWKLYKENHYGQYSKENVRAQTLWRKYIYGSGSRSQKLSNGSRVACQLGYHLLRMFRTIAFRLHSAVYLHSVIGWQTERSYCMVKVAVGRGANTHFMGMHCWIQRMLARIRHLQAGCVAGGLYCAIHLTNERTIDTHTANKGMM